MPDVVELTKALIAAESVTPARGAVFDVLEAALVPLGFAVDRFVAGAAPDGPVENLLATRGAGGRHFAFAGHLDVVPPGKGWTGDAFVPEIRGDLLYGRGAVDMKGAVAAFVAALPNAPDGGTISLIVTGPCARLLLVWDRQPKRFASLRAAWGVPLALLIALPWYVAIGVVTDGGFFATAIGDNLLHKVGTGQQSHGGPPG